MTAFSERVWTVRGYLDDALLALDASARVHGDLIPPHVACDRVEEWFPGYLTDAFERATLDAIGEALGGISPRVPLRDVVREALREGRLVALRVPRKPAATSAPVRRDESAPAPERVSEAPEAWVAIELIDNHGRPVPYERYRIKLPDGTTREGTLDRDGLARIDGIDAGLCEVTFPDLDGRSWRRK